MDAPRFDAITKALITESNRRQTLGGLLGAAFGLLGFATAEAAPNGSCRPRCGTCARCKRGTCRQTPRGRRGTNGRCKPKPNGRSCGTCRQCRGGRCVAVEHGRSCGTCRACHGGECSVVENGRSCGTCRECQGGECVVVENATACSSDNLRRCFGGQCICIPGATAECDNGTCIACGGPQRTNPVACTCCQATGEGCNAFNPSTCCSGICTRLNPGDPTSANGFCNPRREADPCEFDAQCASNDCRNGLCAAA